MGKFIKKIIVLEGLPASGKTTLANLFVVKHHFEKVNESLGRLSEKNMTDDQLVIFDEVKEKYGKATRSDLSCIIDRGVPSMLCWDYCAEKLGVANDLKEKQNWVKKALESGELFEPDYYVYLEINPELSLSRRPRTVSSKDVWSGLEGMILAKEFYKNHFFGKKNVIYIDGSLDPQMVAALVWEKIYAKS